MIVCFSFLFFTAKGYDSGIAVQTEHGTPIQVFVNGKLYNKTPGSFVRVRGSQGLYHVEVKFLNPYTKKWASIKRDVKTRKGFEFVYKLAFVNKKPELREVRKNPVYSKYFLNPALYNWHPRS
ncbi:hypothetical protein DQQ10_03420 [Pseudochryseolinea flava]|uniref:PEGA domain-containing protein n=2 Tax=Pseudochryseolinea flava TaxID=2059302 RepID=A0A364YBJ4_9BACT|nr:hypothetical protein DQQ10_03420 [Pseudochryseolinea flava]